MTLPAAVGANVTPRPVDCPEGRVKGRLGPFTVKPDPVSLTFEIVTPALPVLVSVTGKIALWPMATSPKLKHAGLDVN